MSSTGCKSWSGSGSSYVFWCTCTALPLPSLHVELDSHCDSESDTSIGVNTGGTGDASPRICSGDANVIRPPDFGHLVTCCVMNHSAVHKQPLGARPHIQTRRLLPAVEWCHASALRRSPRRHRVSAFCRRVISCLPAENASNLLSYVILILHRQAVLH